jgi:hypothetical protein
VGRDNQAASNSHADRGTLEGGTRRRRAHPLRPTDPVGRPVVARYAWGGDAGFPARSPHRLALLARLAPALLVVLALSGLTAARMTPPARATVPVGAAGGGAPGGTPAELKAAAADLLAATTAKGGTGYRFEIVQRSTLTARQGGPRIEIPDPADRTKSLGSVDAYYLNGLVETGYVTPAGFYMEMRAGPASTDAAVDLASGELLFRALVRDGTTYRDDGLGWYATEDPPGIGLDPTTAGLLPALLRHAGGAEEADLAAAGGELAKGNSAATRAITATGAIADIPGIVAVDGAPFTEIARPVDFSFDAAGRLVGLVVTARNTNVKAHDLVVVTEIRLAYDDVPVSLPKAEPRWLDADKPLVSK